MRGSLPYLGAALPFGRDMTGFLQRCRREHGDVFTVFIAGRRMTFVCDPLSYLAMLRCPVLKFEPVADEVVARAFDYPEIRKDVDIEATDAIAKRHLRGRDLGELTDAMSREVFRFLEQDERVAGRGGTLPLYRFIWDLIFTAGTTVIFGPEKSCPHAARAFEDLDELFPRLVAGLPRVLLRKGVAGLEVLAELLAEVGDEPSEWMQRRLPYIQDLPPPKRGRAQSTLMWAVNANTIPTAFWTVAHLAADPEAMAAVVAEVDACVEGGLERPATRDELGSLPLVESSIREALRLSAGSMTVREAVEATTLELRSGSWAIRRGDRVCLAPQLTHYDPAVFERPELFRFDRFAPDASGQPRFELEGERASFALMPFGAGKHTCPGRYFAINEIKILVATLLRRIRLEPVTEALPGFQRRRIGLGIYPPDRDLEVRWSRREHAPS